MAFAHPEYLYYLLIIPLLVAVFFFLYKAKINKLKQFAEIGLHTVLFGEKSFFKEWSKFGIFAYALFLAIFSCAGLQVGSKVEEVKQLGIDIYIALDVSNSMLADDLKPSRLEKAKNDISVLIRRLKGDRVGLIVFAGDAFIQFPLTSDYSAANLFLRAVDCNSVSSQGTAIAKAITLASESFDPKSKANKVMIILTDGEDHEGDIDGAIDKANEKKIKLYTIGLGSPEGARIPIVDNNSNVIGYKKDKDGNNVLTKLDEGILKNIAEKGNGYYTFTNNSKNSLSEIFEHMMRIQKSELGSMQISEHENKYYLFLLPALILLILEIFVSDKKSKFLKNVFNKW